MEASLSEIQELTIPPGTLFSFKCLPSTLVNLTKEPFPGQTSADWSAIYSQFSVSHALAYLPNQYDRGHTSVTLCSLYTTAKLPSIVIYKDLMFTDPHASAEFKAQRLRDAFFKSESSATIGKPLMEAIGRVVCMYDNDNLMECAIPH